LEKETTDYLLLYALIRTLITEALGKISSGDGKSIENHVANWDESAMLSLSWWKEKGCRFVKVLCIVCIICPVCFINFHNITLGEA